MLSCRHLGKNIAHANQVIAGKRQQQLKANSVLAPKFGFSYRSDILAPAKYLFNALAQPLADVITAMSGSACIDGRASVGVILCHMRGRPELAKFRNKAFGVVKLVATDRNPLCARAFGQHINGGVPLRRAAGLGQITIQ